MFKHLKILFVIVLVGFIYPQDLVNNQPRIAILFSGLTEHLSEPNTVKIIDVITSWELFLMQHKIPYKVIYDDDLESGINDDFDILILPSVNFISISQFVELQKFLDDGKSIISSGSKLQFENNDPKNYLNVETLFELSEVDLVNSKNINFLHSIIPNQLNQYGFIDNSRLQITTKNSVLQSGTFESNSYPYGYIYSDQSISGIKSSILFGTVNRGKYIWIGFDMLDVVGGKDNLLTFNDLIVNSISWMDNQPDVYLPNFDNNNSSPIVLSIQYNNALKVEVVDSLNRININPVLIVTPEQSIDTITLQRFNDDEIILDLSGRNNLTSDYINESLTKFNEEYRSNITSILIDDQYLNTIDWNSIEQNRVDKILYSNNSFGLPKYVSNSILAVPFCKNDAKHYSANTLNILYYNPKFDCGNIQIDQLISEVDQLKNSKYNFTTLRSIQNWWEVRSKISSQINLISTNELGILITNKNSVEVNDLNVYLTDNNKFAKNTLSITVNNKTLDYSFDQLSGAILIKLNSIRANSTNKIKIKFDTE